MHKKSRRNGYVYSGLLHPPILERSSRLPQGHVDPQSGHLMTPRPFHILLVLAMFLVWAFMLIHAVRLETRAEIMLDDEGRPIEVVWELGKGYRLPTQKEVDHAKR